LDINAFNQPLDQWDVSSVTTINSMFTVNSGQFNQDISMWDVSNINSANGFANFGQNQFNHSSAEFKNSDPYYFNIVSYFNIFLPLICPYYPLRRGIVICFRCFEGYTFKFENLELAWRASK